MHACVPACGFSLISVTCSEREKAHERERARVRERERESGRESGRESARTRERLGSAVALGVLLVHCVSVSHSLLLLLLLPS